MWLSAPSQQPTPALQTSASEPSPPVDTDPFHVQVSFKTLHGALRLDHSQQVVEWLAVVQSPNLAVHYSDHENDLTAVRMLREFLPAYGDDHSLLKLVAFALDSVNRRLDQEYPYWEDLRVWLEDSDFDYS